MKNASLTLNVSVFTGNLQWKLIIKTKDNVRLIEVKYVLKFSVLWRYFYKGLAHVLSWHVGVSILGRYEFYVMSVFYGVISGFMVHSLEVIISIYSSMSISKISSLS